MIHPFLFSVIYLCKNQRKFCLKIFENSIFILYFFKFSINSQQNHKSTLKNQKIQKKLKLGTKIAYCLV